MLLPLFSEEERGNFLQVTDLTHRDNLTLPLCQISMFSFASRKRWLLSASSPQALVHLHFLNRTFHQEQAGKYLMFSKFHGLTLSE